MSAVRRAGTVLLFAAAAAAQFLLQQPLGHANEIRAAREIHTAPASLAFRIAAGGVKEAASDALWLTVLPRLGRPWAEPARKAAWIEAVTGVMVDANPRAITPPLYAAYFLGFIEKRHPGIERVLVRSMEAEAGTPFRGRRKVNAEAWEFPEALGMDMVQYGPPGERARGLEWLRKAASIPTCPTILIDYLAAIGGREGDPLRGWDLWLVRAATTKNRKWMERFLKEADRARLDVLRKWAREAETRLRRWPRDVEEVLAEAPAPVAEALRERPDRRAALVDGVALHPLTRDVEIPSLTKALQEDARSELRLRIRHFEATRGRLPASFQELQDAAPGPILPPPLHGTRWEYDPATGEIDVANDMADPRTRE